MAARSTISRAVFFILGLAGVGAGVLFLFGIQNLEARLTEISTGIAGVAGGVAMIKIAMTSNETAGVSG